MAYEATSSRVELSVRCTGLINLDRLSKSDPICVLFCKKHGVWSEYNRTEVIRDNLNPKFARTFVLPYHFEEEQPLKFAVYDADSTSRDLRKHDFIGDAEFTLANVVVAGTEFSMNLTKQGMAMQLGHMMFNRHFPVLLTAVGSKKPRGKIHVVAEEVEESKTNIEFLISARGLDKKDFFGKVCILKYICLVIVSHCSWHIV
jgi:Ca2+-dependent lipid-binding protein